MSEQSKELIDYDKLFNENNSEELSQLTEKRSIYSLIIYFVVFIIGLGLLIGHFTSQLFVYPYDRENTNELMVDYISNNENNVGLVELNFDYTSYSNIIIVNSILINDVTYNIIMNDKNSEFEAFINDTFNSELDVHTLVFDDNILYWGNDSTNDQFNFIIVVGSNIYDFFSETIDFSNNENTTIIGNYTTAYTTLVNFFIYILATVPILFIFKKEVVYDFMLLKKDKHRALETTLSGFGLMLVFGIGANLIVLIIKGALGISGDSVNQESIINSMQSSSMIFMLITSVILAPIVEELIFRKAIFSLVKLPKLSIIISAALFSLMHILSEPNLVHALINVIPYLSMGVFLGYFYEFKTNRNIGILILMHLLNNLLGALQILFLR